MLAREQISLLADRFHIDPFSVIREYLQVLFLVHLARIPDAVHWFFKGGTAIRLLGNSFRFSEDLDFTVTASAAQAMVVLERLALKIQQEIPEIELRDAERTVSTVTGYLRYRPPASNYPLVLRLQCSLRERPQRPKTSLLETAYPVPYPWAEILAEKVRALWVRAEGRDLFDVWFLLSKGIPLEWPLVQTKMKLYRISATCKDLISVIEKTDPAQLQKDLGPFLPREHRQLPRELKHRLLEQLSKGK